MVKLSWLLWGMGAWGQTKTLTTAHRLHSLVAAGCPLGKCLLETTAPLSPALLNFLKNYLRFEEGVHVGSF